MAVGLLDSNGKDLPLSSVYNRVGDDEGRNRVVDRHWRCALRAEEARYPYRARYAHDLPSQC